jgi:hypothetical protein
MNILHSLAIFTVLIAAALIMTACSGNDIEKEPIDETAGMVARLDSIAKM